MKNVIREFFNSFKAEIRSVKKFSDLKLQIPNILTLSRGIAPFICVPLILFEERNIGITLAILFALTDFFDGKLARKFNHVSEFGKLLDQICDKIFFFLISIPVVIKQKMLLMIFFFEIAISYINIVAKVKRKSMGTMYIGKVKTLFVSVLILLAYIESPLFSPFLIFTVFLEILTSTKYYSLLKNKKYH